MPILGCHDEHRELLPRIETLRAAAEAAEGDGDTLLTVLDDALVFLHRHLIPHAQAEDAALYPAAHGRSTSFSWAVRVIRLHFAKEEEVYLPMLDAGLAPDEADAMFTAMHVAAHRGTAQPERLGKWGV